MFLVLSRLVRLVQSVSIITAPADQSESNYTVYTEQGRNSTHIYIGHVDEMHYVSTSPIIRNQTVSAQSANKQNNTTPTQIMDTSLKPSKTSSNSKNRNEYMRKYMKNKRRQNNEFRKKENERKMKEK